MQEEILKEKLVSSFSKLDLDNQRNEFSREMMVISSLINTCLSGYGEVVNKVSYDYNPKKDFNLKEKDMLIKNYSDIIDLKNNLLLLLTYINKK